MNSATSRSPDQNSEVWSIGLDERSQTLAYFVADFPEQREPRFVMALCRRRVYETPMNALCAARKDGALFISVVTHGDHVIECLTKEFVYRFRPMVGDIDANLFHHLNRFLPHVGWVHARAGYLKPLVGTLRKRVNP